MKKATISTLSAALIFGGLVGCNTNDEAMDNKYDDMTTPIGYYTNDDRDRRFNDYTGREANEGPLTDMFDGDDDKFDMNARDYNFERVGYDQNKYRDRAMGERGNRTDSRLAQRIENRVERLPNIEDVNVVVYGDTVLVGIDTNDRNDVNVESRVRQSVRGLANGKRVRIVSDENIFRRLGTVNDGIRNGGAIDEFQSDLRGIMNDLGDAMQRPFENNR
jgi:spore cortex protein